MKSFRKKWVAGIVAISALTMSATASHAATKPTKSLYGGEVNYAIQSTVSGWCFSNALEGGPLGVTRMVYESLVERDSKGNLIPHLAESITKSEGGKVWTFKLRTGIVFSNGEVFDSAAVKLNFDIGRGFIPTYGSTGIGVNANIKDVAATDASTVVMTLDRADNDFLGLMYRAGRYVMRAPDQIKAGNTTGEKSCSNYGIGTGPFKISSFDPSAIVLKRNDKYWRKDAKGNQLPYLDGINVTVVKEPLQRALAVRKGTVDVAYFTSGEATFVKDLMSRKSKLAMFESSKESWGQWMPNQNKAGSPFKNVDCRLAVAHALDWNSYNKVRLKGLGNVTGSIVGKGHVMYTLAGATPFDLPKAKGYAAKCQTILGATPFKVTLYADTSSQSLNNVTFIKTMLEAAGIGVNPIYQAESAVLIASIYRGGGNLNDFAQGTPAEGPGSGYIIPFFVTKAFPANSTNPVKDTALGKGYNTVIAIGNHSDTKVDDLIYAAQAESDPAKAKVLWATATEYIQSQAIAIPSVHGGVYTFVNKGSKIDGFGKLKNPDGKTLAPTRDIKGMEWTNVTKG